MSPAPRPLNASKVLVTGGAGFIGSATVDELLRTGVGEVVVIKKFFGVHEIGSLGLAEATPRL